MEKSLLDSAQNWSKFLFLFFFFIFVQAGTAQTIHDNHAHHAEELWQEVNYTQLISSVLAVSKLSASDQKLFSFYLGQNFQNDKHIFFHEVASGNINDSNLLKYIEGLQQKYIASLSDFQKNKQSVLLEYDLNNKQSLLINGPCVNMDFETGNRNGWTGQTGDACINPTPCNPSNGFNTNRHVVMNSNMTDPYIPALPVVAPGGNFSIRLENYVNGGDAALIRQTFLVTAANNIFTYSYAVVLEDPGDHDDEERPYFKARLYDKDNLEINCATYTAIAKPPMANYTYIQVDDPNSNNMLDLYYREWTTVSIPLQNYIGQNVTIEFIASDCSRGGHLGYAYVDASCGSLLDIANRTICTGQNLTFEGPEGFAAYSWTGPGVVPPTNVKDVVINQPGNYSLSVIPYADITCPATVNFTVSRKCSPPPVAKQLCESVKGSGSVTGINLSTYNSEVSAGLPSPTVVSWHTAKPASTANRIANITNVTVANGSKYYAVISYPVPGGDTAELSFTIRSLPTIVFPDVPQLCHSGLSHQIAGVSPSGGTFTGTNVSSTGLFNPSVVGSFPITYTFTDGFGCVNSMIKPVVVVAKPVVNAGVDQLLCSNVATVSLAGSFSNAGGISWTGGAFSSSVNVSTNFSPTASNINNGTVTLTITTTGNGPCVPASDEVVINFEKLPIANAGPDQSFCSNVSAINLAGSISNATGFLWSGGGGGYSSNSLTGSYLPSVTEKTNGSVTLILTTSGQVVCPAATDQVTFTFGKTPTAEAGNNQLYCENLSLLNLNGSVVNAGGGQWSGGAGNFSSLTALSGTYQPSANEKINGTVTLTLTTTGNGTCPAATDQVTFTFEKLPTANAGTDQQLCASTTSVMLNASITNASGSGWSGTAGSFAPLNTLNGIFTPTPAEIAAGTVTLTLTTSGNVACPSATDQVTFTFEKIPSVDAGQNLLFCENIPSFVLNGTVINATGGTWSGGSGNFSSGTNVLSSDYFPTYLEKSSGTITLTLTSTGTLVCPAATDQVIFTFEKLPTANAGTDQQLCASTTSVMLNASITNASGSGWSGTSGSFAPLNTLNGIFTPTPAEIAAGTVTLTLTTSGNVACQSATDQVTFTFEKIPLVDAGQNQLFCENISSFGLNGIVSNAPGGIWSGGGGSYSSGANVLNSDYIPTSLEKSSGTTTLTLTSAGTLVCPAATDQVTFTFEKIPTANAGTDQHLCASTTSVSLNASITNATGSSWSGSAGSFAPINTLNGTFTPTPAEIAIGSITLSLTTSGSVACPVATDQVTFTFEKIPLANAGPDQEECANNIDANISGTVSNASGGIWSGGNGTYLPSATALQITYIPTPLEITAGIVNLTLTTSGNLICANHSDQVELKITPAPIVNAGDDIKICADQEYVTLNGNVTVATGGTWTGGMGGFSPDPQFLSSTYTPTSLEKKSGGLQLTLTTTGNGLCLPVSDVMDILIISLPVIEAGPDKIACENTVEQIQVELIPGVIYEWTLDGIILTNPTNSININSINGEQFLKVKSSNADGCIFEDNLKITGVPMPIVTLSDTSACKGLSILLEAKPDNIQNVLSLNPSFRWQKDNVNLSDNNSMLNVTETGKYNIIVSLGSCVNSAFANVIFHELPVLDLPEVVTFCPEDEVYAILDAGSAHKYSWQPTGDTIQIISPQIAGQYVVTVYNEHGCSSTDEVLLKEVCPPRLFIPNAFTPNADGKNEFYLPFGAHYTNYKIRIFNRWGEVIFESNTDVQNWDGIYRGEPIPVGVYPWTITYEGDTEEFFGPYKLEGSVTVVR